MCKSYSKCNCMNPDRNMVLTYMLCLSFAGLVQAQKAVYINPNSISQIHFSVTPAVYSPLEINSEGASLLYSNPGFGGEFAITFAQMISNGFGIEAGLGVATIPYNFSYDFEPAPGSPLNEGMPIGSSNFFDLPPTRYTEGAFIFPLTLVKI